MCMEHCGLTQHRFVKSAIMIDEGFEMTWKGIKF